MIEIDSNLVCREILDRAELCATHKVEINKPIRLICYFSQKVKLKKIDIK